MLFLLFYVLFGCFIAVKARLFDRKIIENQPPVQIFSPKQYTDSQKVCFLCLRNTKKQLMRAKNTHKRLQEC